MTFSLSSSKQPFIDNLLFQASSQSVMNSQDNIFAHRCTASNNQQSQDIIYRSPKNSQVYVYQQKPRTASKTDASGQAKDQLKEINSDQEINKKQSQNQYALQQNKSQLRKGQKQAKQQKFISIKKQVEKICIKQNLQDVLYEYNDQAEFKKNNLKKSIGRLFIERVSEKIKKIQEDPPDPEWIQRMKKVKKKYTRKDTRTRSYSNRDMSEILCLDKKECWRINLKILREVIRDCETIRNNIIITGHGKAFNTMKYMREAKKLSLMCRSITLIKNYFGVDDGYQT